MKQDTRNYGKFHPRFADGGAVEDGKKSTTGKKLEQVAAGNKPWFETLSEGIQA